MDGAAAAGNAPFGRVALMPQYFKERVVRFWKLLGATAPQVYGS